MTELEDVLLRTIPDTPRTRRYQEILDGDVASEQKKLTPEFFTGNPWSRELTAPLCRAAFCRHSPLSAHYRDPRLAQAFKSGLLHCVRKIEELLDIADPESVWSFGWDIEGLIYGITFCRDSLEPDVVSRARDVIHRLARRNAAREKEPQIIGSYGNQRGCYVLGLYLAGVFCDDSTLLDQSKRAWDELLPNVLDRSGQVIEQYGPCMHYSYTAFVYSWLNLVLRGEVAEHEDSIVRSLEWFRARHTDSLYPLAGPSVRCYQETISTMVIDLLPAAEQVAHRDPSLRQFVHRAAHRFVSPTGALPAPTTAEELIMRDSMHGGSALMWSLLVANPDAPLPRTRIQPTPFTAFYEHTHVCKRSPIKYLLRRNANYQTHANATDYLPFSGIQTWAMTDEPPIIHPTPLAPSTTQAYSLDTARQGASHNWGLFGAGSIGIDAYECTVPAAPDTHLVLIRHDWLWRLLVFTDCATVQLEFGNGGERHTFWTLNRIEPANPTIAPGMIRFSERRACLHTTVPGIPELRENGGEDEWEKGIRQLVYACGTAPAAFAFADDSFRFDGAPLDDGRTLLFHDARRRFKVTLPEAFLAPNPGQIRNDVYGLLRGIEVHQTLG